eukprot:2715039-Alexandrium_andersonii.AAC.1
MEKSVEKLSRPRACVLASLNQLARYCWHFCDWVHGNGTTEKDVRDFTLDDYYDSKETKNSEDCKPTSGIDTTRHRFPLDTIGKRDP